MEYEPEFAKSFMGRTLEIVQGYNGPYEATLLINCILGLLVLPKEALLDKIPTTSLALSNEWGIQLSCIKILGKCDYGHQHELNLRQQAAYFRR